MGWINRRRDHGNLIFLDLRDRTGISQVVLDAESSPEAHAKAEQVRSEYVVAAIGKVRLRDKDAINPKMPTGEIEIVAEKLLVLNESRVPPFSPAEEAIGNEELRLKYRYLDLRRPEMQANIEMRHRVSIAIREHLNSRGFFEIETPYMTRSTPEGARDYLVPSRVHVGEFYALPQSPQLFKQILMISGFDKYFQIVRCFRDEDLRADRQPEFTQIDLEMSFPQEETIFETVEGFLEAAFGVAGQKIEPGFPRMSYDEAIRTYGIDKPDMRLPAMTDVKEAFDADALAQLGVAPELPVVCIRIPSVGDLSRKERDDHKGLLNEKQSKAIKFFDDFKRLEKSWPNAVAKIRELTGAAEGDLLVVAAGPQLTDALEGRRLTRRCMQVYNAAGQLRLALAQRYATRHKAFEQKQFKFLWVTDFPMFEWDEQDRRWNAAHHPFTSPHEEDMEMLNGGIQAAFDEYSALGDMRSRAYDIVLNGTELGSGSIRIHRQDVQAKIFEAIGFDEQEQTNRFGFFLEALQYGTPPHGGIALGLDRIVMILAGAPSLREVIPFPKTAQATDLMVDAPTPVSAAQLTELGIKFRV
jgi:aspartyl-tRNA synthetase